MAEKRAETKVSEEVEALKEDIAELSGDVAALLNAFKSFGAEKADGAKASLNAKAERRREDIRQTLLGAKARGETVAEGLEEEIALHPLRSVLVAFGVGYVVAKLLREN